MFDWLVVGAGFAGSVLSERIANVRGESVLIIDRRGHTGGNAFDDYNADGLLVHRYGPHIFHTNAERIFSYLSRFTEWRPYEHRVLAAVEGQLLPIPINLDTVNRLYGLSLSSDELEDFFRARAEAIDPIRTSEDVVVARVGRDLYEKFFRGYTRKQWGLDPSQLDKSVTSRVPVRTNRDDRYFTDRFQAMPRNGYSALFRRMLAHRKVHVLLQADYRDVRAVIPHRRVIYTGPIDEYFSYCYGPLPYRSLRFEHVTKRQAQFQPVGVVNYPLDHDYTRITEYKHLTGQHHPWTALTYEYPSDQGEPYYPVPRAENQALYKRYESLARAIDDVWFVGRLATYRYYNMDQVVGQALATFEDIQERVPVSIGDVKVAKTAFAGRGAQFPGAAG
jgi:UDP-galactopyranose mutase